MKIVVKRVGEIGEVVQVENTDEIWQDIVGGYFETFPLMSDMLVVCNEEGKLMGLEPNVDIVVNNHRELIVGDFAIVRHGNDGFESLTEEQIIVLRNSGLIK